MNQKPIDQITPPAIRIKVTGACNRTCSFCHEEGDMKTIHEVTPDEEFFTCIHALSECLDIRRAMLTGGEPTVHPRLGEIVEGLNLSEISITSNGIRFYDTAWWSNLRRHGLSKVIFSVHDAAVQPLLSLETRRRSVGWAIAALDAQRRNILSAASAGLPVRVNVVAYHSAERLLDVVRWLSELQKEQVFDIRLLNDLSNVEASGRFIDQVCRDVEAEEVSVHRRAGSSNVTKTFRAASGLQFGTKVAYPYYFEPICRECPIRAQCHEGFYGVRIERRDLGYYVRLCIYKSSEEVLMPWQQFLESKIIDGLRQALQEDLA
jgi:cyclic pyranopterin phosphate synthase